MKRLLITLSLIIMSITISKVPFAEAIDYFNAKVQLPTKKWTDIREGMHSRAFVVAGAAKNSLLTDLHGAIQKAIEEGTSITGFRKAFDATVKRNGWNYKGSRGWRTSVIFNTNLSSAYSAGRYKQQTDPDILAAFPYWEYRSGLSQNPREAHLKWNGTVLKANDPWFNTHYTPNGWGCKCKIRSISHAEAKRRGLTLSKAPNDGTYEYTNKETGKIIDVPKGITPGFAYNPGRAAWGEQLAQETMSTWKKQGASQWERLSNGNWETNKRAKAIPLDAITAKPDYTKKNKQNLLKTVLGGPEKVFSYQNESYKHFINVNAKVLADHLPAERAAFLPMLPETLENPYEVWYSFEKHKGTGKVVLRQRIIKGIAGEKNMLVVTNVVQGQLEAWTIIPGNNEKYLNQNRVGTLIWAR